MLVLTREKAERIVIGDREIVITVIDIRGDKVRLGVEARPDVVVDREEVYERKRRQGRRRPRRPTMEGRP